MIGAQEIRKHTYIQLAALAILNGVPLTGGETFSELQTALASAGLPTTVNYAPHVSLWGDGSAGAIVFDGTTAVANTSLAGGVYTLTQPLFASTVTINAGVTVKLANYPLFARSSIVNNGTISTAGNAAAANVGGLTINSNGFYAGSSGGNGGTAAGTAGGGTGAGYGCGQSGAGGAGASGVGGTVAVNLAVLWPYRLVNPLLTGVVLNAAVVRQIGSGAGGGGGGGDGTNLGGGGGSAGGIAVLVAPSVVNNGTITVAGGAGATPTTGNCGGGGGGGAGYIIAVTSVAWTQGTRVLTGGAAGAGVGTGSAGTAGAAGNSLNVVI